MPQTLVSIPVIDFQAFVEGNDLDAQVATSREIYRACHEIGFLYLKRHGIPQKLIDQVFEQSRWLFGQPLEVKHQQAWADEFTNRGYVGIGRERLDETKPGDLKEAFNMGWEDRAMQARTSLEQAPLSVNRFPAENPLFRETMLDFFEACCGATDRILQGFAIALDLPTDFFTHNHNQHSHVLRLLHYPPVTQTPQPDQSRAGKHSDYGSITLLFQDLVDGLEVQTRNGEWIQAPVIPGTVIVNTGDLMQRWTNHVFCSTRHRVGIPTGDRQGKSRYSVAFFCHPNDDTEISCLPTCQSPDKAPHYAAISAKEYLLSRLQATY